MFIPIEQVRNWGRIAMINLHRVPLNEWIKRKKWKKKKEMPIPPNEETFPVSFFSGIHLFIFTHHPIRIRRKNDGRDVGRIVWAKNTLLFSRLLESQGLRYFLPRPFSLHIFKRHILQIHLYSTNIKWDKLNHCFHLIGIFVRITGSDIGGGVRVGNNEGQKKETMEKKREVEYTHH